MYIGKSVICKSDKSNIFVMVDKDVYIKKVNKFLSDNRKFINIWKDNTVNLKFKLIKLIAVANAQIMCSIYST